MTRDAAPGASSEPDDDGAEVAEEHVEVVTYAAAIDVAKRSGMVCTRLPGSRPDRRRQVVWQSDASYAAVVALLKISVVISDLFGPAGSGSWTRWSRGKGVPPGRWPRWGNGG